MRDVVSLADGGFAALGLDTGEEAPKPWGGLWLGRYQPDGTLVSQTTIPRPAWHEPVALGRAGDDLYVLATEMVQERRALLLVRTNKTGEVVWSRIHDDPAWLDAHSMAVGSDGATFIGALRYLPLAKQGEDPYFPDGWPLLLRTDAAGAEVWRMEFPDDAYMHRIEIAGGASGSVWVLLHGLKRKDLLHVSASGQVMGAPIPLSAINFSTSLLALDDGGVAVATSQTGPSSSEIVRFDATGGKVWSTKLDKAVSLLVAGQDGGMVVTGSGAAVALSAAGKVVWENTDLNEIGSSVESVARTAMGHVFAGFDELWIDQLPGHRFFKSSMPLLRAVDGAGQVSDPVDLPGYATEPHVLALAVTLTDDEGVVIGGATHEPGYIGRARLERRDSQGKLQWLWHDTSTGRRIATVARSGSGFVATGWKGSPHSLYVARFSGAGKLLWEKDLAPEGVKQPRISEAAVWPDGSIGVAGRALNEFSPWFVAKLTPDGSTQWLSIPQPAKNVGWPSLLVPEPGGGALVMLSHGIDDDSDTVASVRLVRLSASGALVSTKIIDGFSDSGRVAAARTPDGGLLLGGRSSAGLGEFIAIVRLGDDHQVLWTRNHFVSFGDDWPLASDLVVWLDGTWLLATRAGLTPLDELGTNLLVRGDSWGNILWTHAQPGSGSDNGASLVPLPDGGVFAVSSRNAEAHLRRMDRFGHTNCDDALACAGQSCADGDPCTPARCDAAKGCHSGPMSASVFCAAAEMCGGGNCP